VLILLGTTGFSGGLGIAIAGTLCVVVGMVFITWQAPALKLFDWVERRPGKLRQLAPKLRDAFTSLRLLASPVALLLPTLLSIVGWGCEGVALYLLLQGFSAAAPLPLTVFFYATATLAGAIIPVPGGLGVAEAMIQEQLVRLGGVPQAPATAAMILIRLATLWWAVLVGFAALALLRVRYPRLLRGDARAAEAV
jgi:uncharacterized protein (TIRG00374 family)